MFDPAILTPPTVAATAVFLAVAIVVEWPSDRLPNVLSLCGVVAGIVLALLDQLWVAHLTGLVLGLGLGLIPYNMNLASGGYVKLLAAVGAMIGLSAAIGSTVVAFACLGYLYLTAPPQDQEDHRLFKGSIIIAAGTIVGAALLFIVAGAR